MIKIIFGYGIWLLFFFFFDFGVVLFGFGSLCVVGGVFFWIEYCLVENGCNVVVCMVFGQVFEMLIFEGFNVCLCVYEYGGMLFVVVGEDMIFSNFVDQCFYC